MYKGANGKDEISHLIEQYGIDWVIKFHEERILYSYNHPINTFFFAVREDSKAKLKTLKQIKNDTKTI